jgi:signal transduction histidine kinase
MTTLITLAAAVLAWARFRDRGQRVALFQVAAFAVLALANAVAAALALESLTAASGPSPIPFGEDALYVSILAGVMAAALLVAGGGAPLRGRGAGRPLIVVGGPVAILLAGVALAPLLAPVLPALVEPPAAAAGSAMPALPGATPANALLQVAGAVLFLGAAGLSRRRHRRGGSVSDRYLAVGLVVAAFAQLHLAFYPSAHAGVMTSGGLLYLAFDVILLLGIEAETRAYIVSLRQANLGLVRLREAEIDRAAMEERSRLSRELHDGLAQDLWLAKLKLGRLGALPDLGAEARLLCDELDRAVDSGLAEARQAVMALRMADEPGASFGELVGRYVDDFADRFGLRAEFACDDEVPRLGPHVEAELLRIAQEALSNVRRHADATVVWVRVGTDRGRVVLTVQDNGHGFDPGAVGEAGFGLTSMRERAMLIGGRICISSRPRDGTLISVDVAVPDGEGGRVGEPLPAGAGG